MRDTAELAGLPTGGDWEFKIWFLADELMLYLVHGCLHAAGENDLVESDRLSMRRREAEVLAQLRKKYVFSEVFPS